jgi:hypothetical protein
MPSETPSNRVVGASQLAIASLLGAVIALGVGTGCASRNAGGSAESAAAPEQAASNEKQGAEAVAVPSQNESIQVLSRNDTAARADESTAASTNASTKASTKTPTTPPASKPAPAPQDPNLSFEAATEPVIQRVAPRGAPAPAPADGAGAAPAVAMPPMIVQDDAMAIVNRALANVKDLRSLDCITLTESVGVPEHMRMSGLGLKRRVQLRFVQLDSISMPNFRITHLDQGPEGDVAGAVALFDGKRAILVDDRSRTYFDPGSEWLKVVGPHLPAIPRWYFVERAAAARMPDEVKASEILLPDLVGARILRTEELDGQACDVVEVFKSQNVVAEADGAAAGNTEVVDEIRYIETIHYARSDGMPRRVEIRMLSGPDGAITPGETTTMHYWGVVMNPEFAPSYFRAEPPEGYTAVSGN